jgi:hypothetical protein
MGALGTKSQMQPQDVIPAMAPPTIDAKFCWQLMFDMLNWLTVDPLTGMVKSCKSQKLWAESTNETKTHDTSTVSSNVHCAADLRLVTGEADVVQGDTRGSPAGSRDIPLDHRRLR